MNAIPITSNSFRFTTSRAVNALPNLVRHPKFIAPSGGRRTADSLREIAERDHDGLLDELSSYSLMEIAGALQDPQLDPGKIDRLALESEPLSDELAIRVWDALFANLMNAGRRQARNQLVGLVRADHWVKQVHGDDGSNEGGDLRSSHEDRGGEVLVIPREVLSAVQGEKEGDCSEGLYGVKSLGIQEYRRVEQTVCCYVPSRVARIENVMAREFKEKHSRDLIRSEVVDEVAQSSELESMSDTSLTTRNELTQEIAETLNRQSSFGVNGSVAVQYGREKGPYSVQASSGFNLSSSKSAQLSDQEARTYAEEVTTQAVETLVLKTSSKRTTSFTKEYEENNRHGYDNREGEEHVVGIYRWIDLIVENSMVNYGRRPIMRISVPEPARNLVEALAFVDTSDDEEPVAAPSVMPLADFGITDPVSITETNAASAADYYGIELAIPQKQQQIISKSYTPQVEHKRKEAAQTLQPFVCPVNYEVVKVSYSYRYQWRANSGGSSVGGYCHFNVAGKTIQSDSGYSGTSKKTTHKSGNISFSPGKTGSLPVAVTYASTFSISASFTYVCHLTAEAWEEWQRIVHQELSNAYENQLAEIEEDATLVYEEEETDNPEAAVHPDRLRHLEHQELKRIAIEMMMRPFCRNLGQDFYGYRGDCEYPVPTVLQTEDFEKYVEVADFFNTVFDWGLMRYELSMYAYADQCRWPELLQRTHDDPTHEAFLRAGLAQVLVPVKCRYAVALAYYLETGEILLQEDLVPEDDDDLYAALVVEMENCDEEILVEGTWLARIPTNLTILQRDAAIVEESGLPCCDKVTADDLENTLKPHFAQLARLDNHD